MQITKDSHLDHGLPEAVVTLIAERFAGRSAFFIETVELPDHLPPVPCNLHGPATGEPPVNDAEAYPLRRGDRAWASRMCDRPPAMVRQVTVIAGPHGDAPCVLYTAYGGPLAPREVGDPESTEDSVAFWAEHALGGAT